MSEQFHGVIAYVSKSCYIDAKMMRRDNIRGLRRRSELPAMMGAEI
jgi:hypothetical protein